MNKSEEYKTENEFISKYLDSLQKEGLIKSSKVLDDSRIFFTLRKKIGDREIGCRLDTGPNQYSLLLSTADFSKGLTEDDIWIKVYIPSPTNDNGYLGLLRNAINDAMMDLKGGSKVESPIENEKVLEFYCSKYLASLNDLVADFSCIEAHGYEIKFLLKEKIRGINIRFKIEIGLCEDHIRLSVPNESEHRNIWVDIRVQKSASQMEVYHLKLAVLVHEGIENLMKEVYG